MIVQMKKVSVITLKSHREDTLEKLRETGVVHVFTDRIELDSGDSLKEQKASVERSLAIIPEPDKDHALAAPVRPSDAVVDQALELAQEVLEAADRKAHLEDEKERLERELERLAPWGEFDPAIFRALEDKGVRVQLCEMPRDVYRETASSLPRSIIIQENKNFVRLIAFALGEDESLPENLPAVSLPEQSTSELRGILKERTSEIEGIDETLRSYQDQIPLLQAALEQLEQDLEFARVAAGMEKDRLLQWLTGFVPHDQVEAVRKAAETHGWGFVVRDPDPNEQVPTKLYNPKPIGIIRPVFDLLGTVPGYRELDISFFFLIFFTVFFAMIIGDAGYGLIALGGTIAAARSAGKKGRSVNQGIILMFVLSTATIVWGAITGNWFGYSPFNELPGLRSLVIPQISIDNEASMELIQYLCFVMGTVHLSIAHVWKFLRGLRERPRIKALEQLGWLSMVLGLYYLVLQLVIDADRYPMPDFALTMILSGLVIVIVFSAQEAGRNFFVGIAMGLAGLFTTILDGVGAFSDIVSYIRLFAVGLATLAIAQAFNDMAGGVAEGLGGVPGAVIAVLILFLGHTLNLAMGALSVVVHGVRLNMLEFSQHLGMEWTGVEYTPFKTRSQTIN